jgi:futalosine hydrolase
MELLVCAATLFEFTAFEMETATREALEREGRASEGTTGFLVTGVGIPAALATLMEFCAATKPQSILNIGIAGAYPQSGIAIGDIVLGVSEVYGDVGFELPEAPHFQSLAETPFAGTLYAKPFPLALDPRWNGEGCLAKGCTVNACTGTNATAAWREQVFGVEFETMEGAAVAQVGVQFGIPVSEVRAISNIAARRDMRPENIRRALESLRAYLRACRSQGL